MTTYQRVLRQIDALDLFSEKTVDDVLKGNGFRRLGKGEYSKVYGRKDLPYVLKINTAKDPASYKFYSSLIGRKLPKYFPKVYALRAYVNYFGHFRYVAVMERLHPMTKKARESLNEPSKCFITWLDDHNDDNIDLDRFDVDTDKWSARNKSSIEIIQSVIASTEQYAAIDMHDGNIMVRLPEGDAVLVDPVCSY